MCAAAVVGCGEKETDGSGDGSLVFFTPRTHEAPLVKVELSSKGSCQLDSDCEEGSFCYYGVCTWQCNADNACADGMVCSKNGRCMDASKARDAADDLDEEKNSDVQGVIMGVEILDKPGGNVVVPMGAESVTVKARLAKPLEDGVKVHYVISKPGADTTLEEFETSALLESVGVKDAATGFMDYEFTIPVTTSSLGSDLGEPEQVRLLTSLGEYIVNLMPMQPGTGYYDGSVVSDQFSGVGLPIHFGVEISPESAKTLDDVKSIKLYMPTSTTDLLSPDNATEDGSVKWSSFEMEKKTDRPYVYFEANYSRNGFSAPGSKLIRDEQKINRSIRVEIDGFDAKSGILMGNVRDIIAGLYRDVGANGEPAWGKAEMSGTFQVKRMEGFDSKSVDVIEHVADKEELRLIDEDAVEICTADSFAKLMKAAVCAEDDTSCSLSECATLTWADYQKPENAALAKTCLLGASEAILDDEMLVSNVIEFVLTKAADDESTLGGFRTIADFLKDCAKGEEGICKQRPEIVCASDLIGRAYLDETDESKKLELLNSWHSMMRESYLGPQFAAWQSDVDIRARWLTASNFDGTPAAKVLENANQAMLQEWENEVLTAHLGVLERQFTQTSLEVLRRVDVSSEVISSRDVVLSEYAEAWEGLSDALSLGLRRYNALLTNTTERINKASDLQVNILDLYYVGLIESYINSKTGNTSLNASYGKNLAANISYIRSLKQSFDDLVFMRDAEIVTSTSLDPNSDNTTVLNERKTLAQTALDKAASKRQYVMDKHDAETLDQKEVEDRLLSNLDSLFTELVALCGRRSNCTAEQKEGDCIPDPKYAYCGFVTEAGDILPNRLDGDSNQKVENATPTDENAEIKEFAKKIGFNISKEELEKLTDKDVDKLSEYLLGNKYTAYSSVVNDSEAGSLVLAYRMALQDIEIAYSDYVATVNKANNSLAVCNDYEKKINEWHSKRQQLMADIKSNIKVINEHYDNITEAEKSKLVAEANALEEAYQAQKTALGAWKELAGTYHDGTISNIGEIGGLNITSMSLGYASEVALEIREMNSAFFEANGPDISSDPILRAAAMASASATTGVWFGTSAAQLAMDISAAGVEIQQSLMDANFEYTSELKDREADLAAAKAEADFAKNMAYFGEGFAPTEVEGKYTCTSTTKDTEIVTKLVTTCEGCNDLENSFAIYSENNCPATVEDENGNVKNTGCTLNRQCIPMGLEQWIIQEQNAIDQLDEVNDTMRELFEISDVYERDLIDLDFKRLEYLNLMEDVNVKVQQVEKARIASMQALNNYAALTERATMLKSQYDAALKRKNEITALYMSPAKIFGYAGDLEVVENMIETAKERIYDYLAGVEYFAVRPFVDLRRAIYLARSVNDLEDIITQIDTIRNKCGAPTTRASVELSAREKMGITIDYQDMDMGERFRYVMSKGNIPINALTRYTVDSTVRDLLSSGRDMRAGTFELKIDDYANLAATCNAKIESIAIQLVGENLIKEGEGENVVPTMTVFYDGQTQLVSCQPNIEQLVSSLGPKTSYGKYSTFMLTPTKISPTAGLNTYGEANVHLQGNPVATSYTVLIDTTIGENRKINWDNVDDVKLKLNYTYQDLFSVGSACTNL